MKLVQLELYEIIGELYETKPRGHGRLLKEFSLFLILKKKKSFLFQGENGQD